MKINRLTKLGAIASGAAVLAATRVQIGYAVTCTDPTQGTIKDGANCAAAKDTPELLFGSGSVFQNIANALIFLVGAIAVIMLIVGGLRYVLSNGNASSIESAKNTILYAIIGIVVAILSFAAVNFVINRIPG